MGGEETPDPVALLGAKLRQQPVIDANPAAQPAEGGVAVASLLQRAGAADAARRRVKPQRQQEMRRSLRHARQSFARFHCRLEVGKIDLRSLGPDDARRMIVADQRVKVADQKRDLVTHRQTQPRPPGRIGFLGFVVRKIVKKFSRDSKSPSSQPRES